MNATIIYPLAPRYDGEIATVKTSGEYIGPGDQDATVFGSVELDITEDTIAAIKSGAETLRLNSTTNPTSIVANEAENQRGESTIEEPEEKPLPDFGG